MNWRTGLAGVLVSAVIVGCGTQAPRDNPYDPEGTGPRAPGRLTGVVRVVGTVDPSGVAVHILDAAHADVLGSPVLTDATGRFTSHDLTPATYEVSVDVPRGYYPIAVNAVTVVPGVTTDMGVLSSEAMPAVGVVTGVVTLDDPTASLAATRVVLVSRETGVSLTEMAMTDASGAYSFTALPDGAYDVRAERQDFTPDLVSADVTTVTRSTSTAPAMHLYPISAVARFAVTRDGQLVIGAAESSSHDVSLLLLAFGGVNEMRVSESPTFVESGVELGWRDHDADIGVTLGQGEGRKSIYAQFRSVDATGKERLRSDVYVASIIVDLSPPALQSFVVAPDAIAVDGDRFLVTDPTAVPLSVVAVDSLSPVTGVKVLVEGADAATVPFTVVSAEGGTVSYSTVVGLSSSEGRKTVGVQVRDRAGNVSPIATQSLVIDRSPPVVDATSIFIDDGATVTNDILARLTLNADDPGAGVAEMALGNDSLDCGTANYEPYATTRAWSLPPAQGTHRVFVCFRDAVGNTSQASATIDVDTVAPAAGNLALAGGAPLLASRTVGFTVGGGPADVVVTLAGDLAAVGTDTSGYSYWNSTSTDADGAGAGYGLLPTQVTLSPGDGAKTVSAVFTDRAGNRSPGFFATVELDTTPPSQGSIRVEGQTWTAGDPAVEVFQTAVTIEVAAADADAALVAVSESAADLAACSPATCRSVAASLVQGLSSSPGDKVLYFRFFDRAGNGAVLPGGAAANGEFHLRLTTRRPQPSLSFVTPSSILALQSSYSITFIGSHLATDTHVRIGDFESAADCSVSGVVAGYTCTPANASGDSCGATPGCFNCCRLTLDTTSPIFELTRLSGSYVSRMVTPTPVVGTGVSAEALLLNVVAPAPKVTGYTVIGSTAGSCLRGVLDDCAMPFHDVWSIPESSTPASFDMAVWGTGLMDNTGLAVGGINAQVLYSGALTRHGVAAGAGLIAHFTGLSLRPSDDPYFLRVVTPAPGGGEVDLPFGVNWNARVITHSTPTELRKTDFITREEGVFLERYASPNVNSQTGLLRASPLLTLATPEHALDVRAAGELRYRFAPGYSAVGFPLGATPATFEVSGRPGHSRVEIASTRPIVPAGTLGAEEVCAVGQVNDYYGRGFDVAVGDVTGDGIVDLVVSNDPEPNIEIVPGDGTTTFCTGPKPARIKVFSGQVGGAVALADFDHDGRLDIVVASTQGPSLIYVQKNLGGGQFERIGPYDGGWYTKTLRVADLDNDGNADVITGGGTLEVLFGVGTGELIPPIELAQGGHSWPDSVDVGDLDGNGTPDLVAAFTDAGLGVYLNRGDGTFYGPFDYAAGAMPISARLADVNRDGVLDVIVGEGSAGGTSGQAVAVILGKGDGTFAAPQLKTLGFDVFSVDVADVDGDATPDVLAVRGSAGWYVVDVLRSNGDGTLTSTGTLPIANTSYAFRRVVTADVDGNGIPDLVTVGHDGITRRVAQTTTSTPPGTIATAVRQSTLATSDFNHDGWPDVVGSEYWGLEVFPSVSSSAVFGAAVPLKDGSDAFAWVGDGDFNNDGNADVIAVNSATKQIRVFHGDGAGAFPTNVSFALPGTPDRIYTVDVNADGRLDIVVIYTTGAQLGVFLQQGAAGSPTLSAEVVTVLPQVPRDVAALDANADGRLDLAVLGRASPSVYLLYGHGDGTFKLETVESAASGWATFIKSADIDRDGHPDLLVLNGDAVVYRGNSAGAFEKLSAIPMSAATAVVLADFNGDGILDLAGSDDWNTSVNIREGHGDGTFGALVDYAYPTGRIGPLAFGDFDRDHVPDLVVGESSEDNIGLLLYSPSVSPRPVRQELTDLPLASVGVAAAPGTQAVTAVHQAAQDLVSVGVYVQLGFSSAPTGTVDISLVTPDGRTLHLGSHSTFASWPSATAPTRWLLTAAYPTVAPIDSLASLVGTMPAGDWGLVVNNGTGQAAELLGFKVSTLGRLVGPAMGDRVDHPVSLLWPAGGIGTRRVEGTTMGYSDKVVSACATAGAPDALYELTLAAPRMITATVVADYDPAVELWHGTCAARTSSVGCNNDISAGVVRSARLAPGAQLTAGTYCLIVDGNGANRAGNFALSVQLDCTAGFHDGGDRVCVATGTCSTGYDPATSCTTCFTGYHDNGQNACVPVGTCAAGYVDGGDGSCVAAGTCATGYHDGGAGTCVLAGTCSTGWAVDGSGDCTLCATGYHSGGPADTCVPVGTCSPGYHDGGDGSCVPAGGCALGYHDDGLGVCVAVGTCATGYHDGGFGACIPAGTCESSHILAGDGTCSQCVAGYTANTSGQCLLSGLACPADDAYEQNDTPATAAGITAGTRIDGVVCGADQDWYLVPVTVGCTAVARLYFSFTEGDIGVALLDPSGVVLVDSKQDNEVVSGPTTASPLLLVVYPQAALTAVPYALYFTCQ